MVQGTGLPARAGLRGRFDAVTANRRVVQVAVASAAAELAADLLWQAGPSAVSEVDLGGGRVLLTADVTDTSGLAALPEGSTLQVLELDGDAYLDLWRDWATPVRAGRHVVLHPAWLPRESGNDDDTITILIDPGRAFGSGSHPSTRLVVAALEQHLRPGDRVLDVGTGSGVLAVVACLLGGSQVLAIDVDPAAVGATEANAVANGVADQVVVSTVPLGQVTGTFEVVLANIGARVLQDMADDLVDHVAPGGVVLLSGLLEEQADEVVSFFRALHEVARLAEAGWAAPVLRSPG